jgi:hypothetical protein
MPNLRKADRRYAQAVKKSFIPILALIFISCTNNSRNQLGQEKQIADTSLTGKELIAHVKLAINPKFKNWVLFVHGSYIILPDSLKSDPINNALKIMKEYGPVYPGSSAGDFSVIALNKTEGWIIAADYYGMYTYVHPDDLTRSAIINPSDIQIGLFGRKKREQDAKDLKIIFVNRE